MKKFFDNWILSLVTMLVIAGLFIGGYHFAIRPNQEKLPTANGGGQGLASVSSQSCIACHTDESVIAASTVGQEEVEEASGG